jgi:signal transduction histidine kinase
MNIPVIGFYRRLMREWLLAAMRDRRLSVSGDILLAVALAGTALVPVLNGVPAFGPSVVGGVALALASTLPVAWRGRYPVAVVTILLVGNGLDLYAAAPNQGALQPFVALVLAGYSVGSRAEGRYSVVLPACLAAAAAPVFVLALANGQSLGNLVTSYIWLLAAWGGGRVVRGMRIKTAQLEAANEELAQHRELALQAAIAVERGRIARELHDVVAHNVSLMVVQAGAASHVLGGGQPDVRSALDAIASTGRQTVDEMRSMLGVLRGTDSADELAPQPGLADLGALLDGLRRAGLVVSCRVEGDAGPLPRALDLTAYRIVQEALTNTVKHSGGGRACVVISHEGTSLDLTISDTAGTAPPASSGTGHGLVGMRERAAMFGGELTTSRTPDGFRVHASLPLAAVPTA